MYETREVETLLPRQLIGNVAVVWMFGVAVIIGAQIYSALDIGNEFGIDGPGDTKWTKMALLSQTGGIVLLLGTLAGLVLVAIAGPARARAASVLGVALGFWAAVAGVLGVVVAFHRNAGFGINFLSSNRFVFGLASAAGIAMAVAVMILGVRLLGAGGGLTDPGADPVS
jgi:hypothetical protein